MLYSSPNSAVPVGPAAGAAVGFDPRRRRKRQNRTARRARTAMTTPTPIPALAPVDRPLLDGLSGLEPAVWDAREPDEEFEVEPEVWLEAVAVLLADCVGDFCKHKN